MSEHSAPSGHSPELAEEKSLSAQLPAILGAVGFILLFVLISDLAYVTNRPDSAADAIRSQQRIETRASLDNEGINKITTYRAIDAEKGVYQIPISRAMDLTLADLLSSEGESR
ncbi:MAG: hypothetical protein ACFCU4_07800 [Puniceicoccaceae bacterium]